MEVSLLEAQSEVLPELRAGRKGNCCVHMLFAGAAHEHDPVLLNSPETKGSAEKTVICGTNLVGSFNETCSLAVTTLLWDGHHPGPGSQGPIKLP